MLNTTENNTIPSNVTYSILVGLLYYVCDKYLDCGLLSIIVIPLIIEFFYENKK